MPVIIDRFLREVSVQEVQCLEIQDGKIRAFADVSRETFDRREVCAHHEIMRVDYFAAVRVTENTAVSHDRTALLPTECGHSRPVVVDWAVDAEVASRGDLRRVVGEGDARVRVLREAHLMRFHVRIVDKYSRPAKKALLVFVST